MRWLLLLAMATPALAEDEPAATYRVPLVAVDVASVAALVVPLSFDGELEGEAALWTARAGVAMVAFGGSAVHAIYGEYDRALGSFVLRAGGATVGGIVGRALPCESPCKDDQMAIGAVIGVGAAMVVETIWFADKPVPKERAAIVPYVAGSQLGVAGRF